MNIILSSPPQSLAQDSAALVEAEVAALRQSLVQAFQKRDTQAMLDLTTPEIVVTWQNAEISRGKEDLRKFIEKMISGPESVVSAVTGNPTVDGRKIYNDHVISYGHMNDSFTLRATRQTLAFDSRYSAFLVRQDGRLLLAGLHLSVNAFDNAILSAALSFSKKLVIGSSLGCLFFGFALGWWFFGRKKA